MSAVETAQNIGPTLGRRLRSVGISTREALLDLGDAAAFARLVEKFPEDACVHTRLALAGAVRDIRWFGLDEAIKQQATQGLTR